MLEINPFVAIVLILAIIVIFVYFIRKELN